MSKLDRAAAGVDCYCVCHSPFSSCAYCDHCKGINSVSDFHLRKAIAEKDALIQSMREALDAIAKNAHYTFNGGRVNCRFCDNSMDHEGTYRDMHDSKCLIHQVRAALAQVSASPKEEQHEWHP